MKKHVMMRIFLRIAFIVFALLVVSPVYSQGFLSRQVKTGKAKSVTHAKVQKKTAKYRSVKRTGGSKEESDTLSRADADSVKVSSRPVAKHKSAVSTVKTNYEVDSTVTSSKFGFKYYEATSSASVKRGNRNIDVYMTIDYPLGNSPVLENAIHQWISSVIRQRHNHNFTLTSEANHLPLYFSQLKSGLNTAIPSHLEVNTENIEISYVDDNEKYISYTYHTSLESEANLQGESSNDDYINMTFRKSDGAMLGKQVLRSTDNQALRDLLKESVQQLSEEKPDFSEKQRLVAIAYNNASNFPLPKAAPMLTSGGLEFDYGYGELGATDGCVLTVPYENVKSFMSPESIVLVYSSIGVVKINGVNYEIKSGSAAVADNSGNTLSDIVLEKSISYGGMHYPLTELNDRCFSGCRALKTLRLPDTVVKIGDESFMGCSELVSISLPQTLTTLGDGCFSGCGKLSSINIPDKVSGISKGCFMGCIGLRDIILGAGIKSIGSEAFENCTSVQRIVIPEGIEIISDKAFSSCTSLQSVKIPNSVKNIQDECFSGCIYLSTLTLSSSLEMLGNSVFSGCTRLQTIDIPATVRSIGVGCFNDCPMLANVSVNWPNPEMVAINPSEFRGMAHDNTLIVPKGTKKLYKAKYPWSNFESIK
jgi:hypothetical protein